MKLSNSKQQLSLLMFIIIPVIITFSFVFIPSSFSDTVEDQNTLIVVGDKDHPPYSFVDEAGVYKGFSIDIIKAIALETGHDIKIYYLPWWEVEKYIEQSKADIILGINYSEVTRNKFSLSNSYFKDQQSIFVRSDNYIVTGIEDLEGKVVGIQRGEAINQEIKKRYKLNYKKTETQPEGLMLLLKGEIDAFIGNELTATYWLQKNNKEKDIKIAGDALASYNYSLAVSKEDKELIQELNKGLQEIQRKGTYEKIYQKWFGHYILEGEKITTKMILLLVGMALVVLIIILVLVRINRLLKKIVDEKTSEILDINRELGNVNNLLRTIFSNVKTGFILMDRKLDITMYNSQALEIFELMEEIDTKLKLKNSLEQLVGLHKISEVLNNKKELLHQELQFKKDVITKSIGFNLTLTEDANWVVISTWDKTEEKRYLHKMIIDDKLSALGRLVSGIVHEIRNPLMTIKVLVDIIPQKINETKFRESLTTILPEEINRLTSLLNELLDYSKPSQSRKQILGLRKLLQSLLSLFEPILTKKGLTLTYNVGATKVFCDENHLKQVLINLIFNAIEAVESKTGFINIEAKEIEEKTYISISDNGYGISEKDLDKIFDPFYTTKEKGTGLGLATTYQLIQENEGEIYINSETQKGTSVDIILRNSPGGHNE